MDSHIYVAIQGEKGSFHEVAANDFFSNENIALVPCSTFDDTVNSVIEGRAEYAVMAIENARAGSILYNYTLSGSRNLRYLERYDSGSGRISWHCRGPQLAH